MGLSIDAKVVGTSFFPREGQSLVIGGDGANSILSDRANDAINELITAGYVSAEPYNNVGKIRYKARKDFDFLLTFEEMDIHGRWSATVTNPKLRPLI